MTDTEAPAPGVSRSKPGNLATAEAIVSALFCNGSGEQAKRLVLELSDNRDGGGWSRWGARTQILRVLEAMQK